MEKMSFAGLSLIKLNFLLFGRNECNMDELSLNQNEYNPAWDNIFLYKTELDCLIARWFEFGGNKIIIWLKRIILHII